MGIENRPYIGTWQLGRQEVVQHTPDALVYINGDTSVPGCPKCNGKIDLQEFITEVSVEAGTEPGGASASFTMSIPIHHTDSFARDAKFILRPGLEIHIYMRGYFPAKGLYANLAEPDIPDDNLTKSRNAFLESIGVDPSFVNPQATAKKAAEVAAEKNANLPTADEIDAARTQIADQPGTSSRHGYLVEVGANPEGSPKEDDYRKELNALEIKERTVLAALYDNNPNRLIGISQAAGDGLNVPGSWVWGIMKAESDGMTEGLGTGTHFGMGQMTREQFEQAKQNDPAIVTWDHADNIDSQYALWSAAASLKGLAGNYSNPGQQVGLEDAVDYWLSVQGTTLTPAQKAVFLSKAQEGVTEYDSAVASGTLSQAAQPFDDRPPPDFQQAKDYREGLAYDTALAAKQAAKQAAEQAQPQGQTTAQEEAKTLPPALQAAGPSLLEKQGLQGSGVEDVLAYPYYHVFHGVVTQVSHSWSGGVNTVTVQCASMLHFWQYHTISTNASVFGARPKNSKLKTSMVGHNFTGMHPYQIIYSLHHDMVGAAGGVGWALSQKTNQTAKSEVGGESLFSLNIRYWKRRFDTEMIKLRLHGATGELFSTAQAAFLGTSSSAALTQLIRGRFTDPSSRKKKAGLKGLMEQSEALGLYNNRRLEALRFGQSRPSSTNSTRFELNLVEMQAFVSNISNWGQVQLFEGTYESKLDIAIKVCEVTGFEFYQDVDGDFVFKPPMYNMDTSSSRVYRIEDIDIININFDEKEPEVTYVTVKGSQGKNIEYGVDNEWGHQGQYIDYRLVAKFGWRPHEYEAAYFNDAKSMFFSAVNRMDILNAPVNSASVTIPIRAEMRPGYPVYIPYLDCFYYCTSFSHSFSVGGQCTTSLQLVAKRSKFFAPGKVGPTAPQGIEAIDLSNTILPERPLQVLDSQGRPRLSGFPNVVMALDPDDVNELFFVVGNDLENIGNPRILKSILKRGLEMGILSFDPVKGTYRMKVEVARDNQDKREAQWVEFFLQDPDLPVETPALQSNTNKDKGKGKTNIPTSPVNILSAARAYQQRQEEATEQITRLRKSVFELDQKILDAQNKKRDLVEASHAAKPKQKEAINNDIEKISEDIEGPNGYQAKKEKLIAAIDAKQAEFDNKLQDADKEGVNHLVSLFRQIGQEFFSKNSDVANLDSTVNLLDMLSDKKATFSNGTQPGSYRYYSCSHPDPAQQGQAIVRYNQTAVGGKEVEKRNPLLAPQWQGVEVDGYLPTAQVTSPYPGAMKPEAQLGKTRPVRGVRVLTSNKTLPRGEVLPTSEIRELMFSVQEASVLKDRGSKENTFVISNLPQSAQVAVRQKFTLSSVRAPTTTTFLSTTTPVSLYTGMWDTLVEGVLKAEQAANDVLLAPNKDGKVTSKTPPLFPELLFPSHIRVGNATVAVDVPFGQFKFRDNPAATTKWGPSGSEGQTMAQAADRSGNGVSKDFISQLNRNRKIWVSKLGQAGFKSDQVSQAAGAFNMSLLNTVGIPASGTVESKTVVTSRKDLDIYSPVFPVSDSQGYEVIGSYRYGRDVSIEPQNIFQGMHFQDIFTFLDKETVTNILNAFVRKSGVIRGVPERDANGNIVRDDKGNPRLIQAQATNRTAQNALEQHLLDQLRRNLTTQQIHDLFGIDSDDPNALEGGLRNYIADKLKDGIQKLPVINAAYSLADLQLRTEKKVCSCKSAEAEVLLEAFSEQDFVQFTSPGDRIPVGFGSGEMDQATQYVVQLTARASASWAQSQDALRGAVLDRGGSQLVGSVLGAVEQLTQGSVQQREDALRALRTAANDLGEDF